MQLRNVSRRLLGAVVTLLLPLHAMAQGEEELLEAPIHEYDAGALFDDDGPAEPDWIASVRIGVGVNHQGVDSSLRTLPFRDNVFPDPMDPTLGRLHAEGIVRGPFNEADPGKRPPLSFIGPIDGINPVDGPSLAGGFEIMGPPIERLLGDPRPFFVLDYRDQLEGKGTTVRDQTRPDNNRLFEGGPQLIDDNPKNKRIVADGNIDQEFWLLAGVGVAFQLPIEGYNVKLKPSLNYFYSRSMSQVILIQSVQVTAGAFDSQFTRTAEQASTNHGIAPRIEFDAEIYRDGPLSIGFYLALDFLVVLAGPLEHQIDVASCFGDGEGATPCSRIDTPGTRDFQSSGILSYQLARDRLTYQGTAGLRFSWMGGP